MTLELTLREWISALIAGLIGYASFLIMVSVPVPVYYGFSPIRHYANIVIAFVTFSVWCYSRF